MIGDPDSQVSGAFYGGFSKSILIHRMNITRIITKPTSIPNRAAGRPQGRVLKTRNGRAGVNTTADGTFISSGNIAKFE